VVHEVVGHGCSDLLGDVLEVLLVLGREDHVHDPDPEGGEQLLLDAPHRQHLAPKGDLAGHSHVHRTGMLVKAETSVTARVIPADGPSFGMAPSGTCTWTSLAAKISGVDTELVGFGADEGQGGVGRLLHDIAELAGEGQLALAAHEGDLGGQ
jgi:hypothetical protein